MASLTSRGKDGSPGDEDGIPNEIIGKQEEDSFFLLCFFVAERKLEDVNAYIALIHSDKTKNLAVAVMVS